MFKLFWQYLIWESIHIFYYEAITIFIPFNYVISRFITNHVVSFWQERWNIYMGVGTSFWIYINVISNSLIVLITLLWHHFLNLRLIITLKCIKFIMSLLETCITYFIIEVIIL